VIGAPTDEERYGDALALFEDVFSEYRQKPVLYAREVLAEPSIRYSGGALPLEAAHGVRVGVRPNQEVAVSVRAPNEVEGPIADGAALGRATVRIDGIRAASVPLKAANEVPEASAWDHARSFAEDNLGWIALVLSGILGAVALLGWRRRSR
jgi:D-alanyl-D-alanine carboxypeptidase